MKHNVLIKCSGDIFIAERLQKLVELAKREIDKGFGVIVIAGGGTQITEALNQVGFQKDKDYFWEETVYGGKRRYNNMLAANVAKDILFKNVKTLRDLLEVNKIPKEKINILIPYQGGGENFGHINGDQLMIDNAECADKIIIVTLEGRDKTNVLKQIPQGKEIEIVAIK